MKHTILTLALLATAAGASAHEWVAVSNGTDGSTTYVAKDTIKHIKTNVVRFWQKNVAVTGANDYSALLQINCSEQTITNVQSWPAYARSTRFIAPDTNFESAMTYVCQF